MSEPFSPKEESPQDEQENFEFQKKEEIGTMAKDLATQRQKESLSLVMPPRQEEIPETSYSHRKQFTRVLIGFAVLFFLGAGSALGYWFFFYDKQEDLPPTDPLYEYEVAPENLLEEPTEEPSVFTIQERLVDQGWNAPATPRAINTIILHSVAHSEADPYNLDGILETFSARNVSYHYLIGRDGTIWRTVPDSQIAFHAFDRNYSSLGIGMVYQESEEPADIQYKALVFLLLELQKRYTISLESILLYSEARTDRYTPWNFDRNRLKELLSPASTPQVLGETIMQEPSIVDKPILWGFVPSSKPREIEAIIVHSAYHPQSKDALRVENVLSLFLQYGVAPHYIIDQQGIIYRLVDDHQIAFHAGKSVLPDGRTTINQLSLGIELIYPEHESPTEKQYRSLANLVAFLQYTHTIPREMIFGHKDISGDLKTDPWNFDWNHFFLLL